MKKWSVVALLILGATILGATVLREPIAHAAQSTATTIVGPLDANGDVKVHEQGTVTVTEGIATDLIARQVINAADRVLTVDVSSYREIRLASNGWGCGGGAVEVTMMAVESGNTYPIDAIPVCDAGGVGVDFRVMRDKLNRTYEIPGRTLQLVISGDGGIALAIFARRN
jgi:hypothetical protein